MKTFLIAFLLCAAACVGTNAQSPAPLVRTSLNAGWQFRQADKTDWHDATVPGCVHTDLLANKLIEDPFYRDNEKSLQWIGKTDWEYQTTFNVSGDTLRRQNVEIVFYGLDTYANVFLNDKPILNADNMFRTWRVDVKRPLKTGQISLRIVFRSPINEILPIMAKLDYELPAVNDQGEKTSPYTRKAPYHYGWDWGPRFVTSGVWKPVESSCLGRRPRRRSAYQAGQTHKGCGGPDCRARGRRRPDDVDATLEIENVTDKKVVAAQTGIAVIRELTMLLSASRSPIRNYGGRSGWAIRHFTLFGRDCLSTRKIIDEQSKRTGFARLSFAKSRTEHGISFEFIVNGIPVFGRGCELDTGRQLYNAGYHRKI